MSSQEINIGRIIEQLREENVPDYQRIRSGGDKLNGGHSFDYSDLQKIADLILPKYVSG